MEVKLESLIEKIKSEGVEGAQKQSDEILQKANDEADKIIKNAHKEAKEIVAKAEIQAKQFQENAELAIKQAARDGELLFKKRLSELFDNVFKRHVGAALDSGFLNELILKIVDKWSEKSSFEITISKDDKKELENLLFSGLKKDVKDSITLKVSSDISKGFRIGVKGENVYYDFSDESIAELLRSYLNPRINEILGTKNG